MCRKVFAGIIALFLAILAIEIERGVQSAQQKREEWSVNVPSSPLEIIFSPSRRDMEFLNRSSGRINHYRLGCVRQVGEGMRVFRKFPIVKADLSSGEALINSVTHYAESVQRCSIERGKFAVIEVGFRDGSDWKVK